MRKPHGEKRVSKASESSPDPVSVPPPDELTCSEGQIEDLLSRGESTEDDREKGYLPEKRIRKGSAL